MMAKRRQVADAIRDHYKPARAFGRRSDRAPFPLPSRWLTSWTRSLAFFAIDEKPTGSGDPYALRRASVGRHPIGPGQRSSNFN